MKNQASNSDSKNVLIVMAKRPSPGYTKTRLSPPLSIEQAARLYECFLQDTLALMRRVTEADPAIAYIPAGDRLYFEALAPDFQLLVQVGANLGERLDSVSQGFLDLGYQRVVLINSDGPTLPINYLHSAFKTLLADRDIVIGPSDDGGYYLIGMKKPIPRLLRSVQMSTPDVLADTLKLAAEVALDVHLLPSWYDVDDAETFQRLLTELKTIPERTAAFTRAYLSQQGYL